MIATTVTGAHEALALADEHPGVFAGLGIHPHEAGGPEAERLEELLPLLRHARAVAVGETGLDFYRDYAPRPAQRRLFARQLELARELASLSSSMPALPTATRSPSWAASRGRWSCTASRRPDSSSPRSGMGGSSRSRET